MSKQLPPLPHQTILRTLHSEELPEPPYTVYGFTSEQLQAYATAATEPLLQQIAELERQLHEQAVSLEEARAVLKATGLLLHHFWCDVQMNEYSFEKLNKGMEAIDEAMQKGQS